MNIMWWTLKTRSRGRLTVVTAIVVGFGGGYVYRRATAAGTPAVMGSMTYAGTLYNGNTPVDGTMNIEVDLWDDPTSTASTNKTCSTLLPNAAVTAGRFRIPLDPACTTAAAAAPNLWSEVLVNGSSLGRTPVTAVPFAAQAGSVSWAGITGVPDIARGSGLTVNSVPRVSSLNPSVLGPGALTDDGSNLKTTLPIKFPDNSVQSTAAVNNAPTTQTVVTASRAAGTVYQNTTGKVMWVMISSQSAGSAITDSNPSPTKTVAYISVSNGAIDEETITFLVLPGNYYKFTGSFEVWTESY
jgi:hypothetical protein